MKNLQAFTYGVVVVALFIHHIPYLRAGIEVKTDYYYRIMAEDMGLWE
jgi:hypothetical protein